MSRLTPLSLVPLLLALCACAAPREAAVALPGTADAERALLRSMANVDRAMSGFGGEARSLASAAPGGTSAPSGRGSLRDRGVPALPADGLATSVRYTASGSLDDLARALADSAGYRFATNATPATRPVPVKLDAQAAPVLELLRSLGAQAGADADVRVNQAQRLVEIRHRA